MCLARPRNLFPGRLCALHDARHLRNDGWTAVLGLDHDGVPWLLRHDVAAVHNLLLDGVVYLVGVLHRRARRVRVVVAARARAALVCAGVLLKPRELPDGLEPGAVASEGLRARSQGDQDPEEDRDFRFAQIRMQLRYV